MQNRCSFPESDSPEPTYRYPFLDPALAVEFERLCRDSLGEGGRDVRIVQGYALVEGMPGLHGLHNLADQCAQLPRALWDEEIQKHLALNKVENQARIMDRLCNEGFDQNAARLVVRLHPEGSNFDLQTAYCVQRTDIPGLQTALALDMGPSIVAVPRLVSDRWGKTDEELFARAIANLSRHCTGELCGFHLPKPLGMRFEFLEGGPYAAASILRFDELPLPKGRHGNLLGLPVRDSMISWAIDSWPSDDVIASAFAMARGRHGLGPYRISPHLYWRTPDGQFEQQRCLKTSRGNRLVASPGFALLRERLRT